MRLCQFVFALSLVVCLNEATHAEPPTDVGGRMRARALLADGNDKLDRGLWAEALKLFEDAYRVFPSPKLHFNIAQALYQLRRPLEALERYERFVREINKEEHQTEWRLAQERVFELQAQIATIDIQCSVIGALVTLDGREVGKTPLPRPVRVVPGAVSIVISKPGYERQVIEVTLKAGDSVTQRVKLLTETEALGSRQDAQSVPPTPGSASSSVAHDLPPSVLFTHLAPSVVVVNATLGDRRGQGSGIVIGREQIVTNHHVIDGASEIEVVQGGRTFTAGLASFDAAHDLAILRVPGLDLPRVTQRRSSLVQVGEHVYAIGAPRGLELSLSDGLIAALRVEKGSNGGEAGAAILQTTTPISPGSSGGGLFDAQGRLIGITTFSAINGQSLNFALPTEWIAALEKDIAVGVPSPPSPAVPQYSVTNRPEALICSVQTQSTWGLFAAGAELLETRAIREIWQFERFNTQLTRLLAPQVSATYGDIQLVLSDYDRVARFMRFSRADRSDRMEYFFTINEDGAFQVISVAPSAFHGQLRAMTTSGPCEALTMAGLAARRDGEGARERERERERELKMRKATREQEAKQEAEAKAQLEQLEQQAQTRRRERKRVLPVTLSLMAGGAAVTVMGIALTGVGYAAKDGDRSGTLDQYLGSVATINGERGAGMALVFIGLAAAAAGAITMAHPPHIERRKQQATVAILPSLGGAMAQRSF
ncbi:trypsin-like peptidase domain-containing protein [Haliangium sp. UPWRP_2]|uniref:trypsin-like peptidase domain-containing protein n=1 Tax=Haliangium sp. UPWRP_2 TaxID=1931276 RepID=UPI000B54653B|nr:trypsin-like peptidase domain-containing protein [Haliangium sp. UPWRP_2]PSM32078.1 PEGA domain-containing protein [Haliangium sp. UPWRP_2]